MVHAKHHQPRPPKKGCSCCCTVQRTTELHMYNYTRARSLGACATGACTSCAHLGRLDTAMLMHALIHSPAKVHCTSQARQSMLTLGRTITASKALFPPCHGTTRTAHGGTKHQHQLPQHCPDIAASPHFIRITHGYNGDSLHSIELSILRHLPVACCLPTACSVQPRVVSLGSVGVSCDHQRPPQSSHPPAL